MTPVASANPGIVIVTHEYAPFRGGVATYSAELAAALHHAGQTIEVWTPDYGVQDAGEESIFPVVRLRAGGSLGFWDMAQFVRQLAARRAQLETATVLLTSVGAHMAFMILMPLRRVKCRHVFSLLHGSEVLRFERSPFWRFWARRFFPQVECVLTVSQFSRSLIERSFLSSLIQQIVMAPCSCSTAAIQSVSVGRPNDDNIRVLTLARVHPRKGQLDTAQALALLPPELRGKVIYQIGGKGDTEYLRKVEQTCRDASVAFDYLGEITNTLAQTYELCDIFVMTSRTLPRSVEGFGITYLEAGFHGKPVVGYRSGGAAEAVVDGESGFLVEEGDVAALVKVLRQLMADPVLRQRLGEGGRRHAAKFSWDTTARTILNVVDNS
jgi:phosphatidylinositol alpha-1,6-mannosyltransferase